MRDTGHRLTEKMCGKSRSQFLADDTLVLAVTHLLQIIGEAARLVSGKTRESFPGIPWPLITGMRHRIVHDYLDVDLNVVWITASRNVPELIMQLETMPHLLVVPDP